MRIVLGWFASMSTANVEALLDAAADSPPTTSGARLHGERTRQSEREQRHRDHREYDPGTRREFDSGRRDRDPYERDDERLGRRPARSPSPDPIEREREEAMRDDLTVLVQRIHPRADDFEIFEFFSQAGKVFPRGTTPSRLSFRESPLLPRL